MVTSDAVDLAMTCLQQWTVGSGGHEAICTAFNLTEHGTCELGTGLDIVSNYNSDCEIKK